MAWWHKALMGLWFEGAQALRDRAKSRPHKDGANKQDLKRRASEAKAKWHEHKLKNNPRYREAYERQQKELHEE